MVSRLMLRRGRVLALAALLIACPTFVYADTPEPEAKQAFDRTVDAIAAGNRDALLANATDAMKQAVTQSVMEGLTREQGRRLKTEYEAKYLCELAQRGHRVHLWKLTFKDGGDDVVIRLALRDGKLAGLFFQ